MGSWHSEVEQGFCFLRTDTSGAMTAAPQIRSATVGELDSHFATLCSLPDHKNSSHYCVHLYTGVSRQGFSFILVAIFCFLSDAILILTFVSESYLIFFLNSLWFSTVALAFHKIAFDEKEGSRGEYFPFSRCFIYMCESVREYVCMSYMAGYWCLCACAGERSMSVIFLNAFSPNFWRRGFTKPNAQWLCQWVPEMLLSQHPSCWCNRCTCLICLGVEGGSELRSSSPSSTESSPQPRTFLFFLKFRSAALAPPPFPCHSALPKPRHAHSDFALYFPGNPLFLVETFGCGCWCRPWCGLVTASPYLNSYKVLIHLLLVS